MNLDIRKKDLLGHEWMIAVQKSLNRVKEIILREVVMNEYEIENPNYFAKAFVDIIATEFVEHLTDFHLAELAREQGFLPKNPNAEEEYLEFVNGVLGDLEDSLFSTIDRIEAEKIIPMTQRIVGLRFETFNYNHEKEFSDLFNEICQIEEEFNQMNEFDWLFLDARDFAASARNKVTKRAIKTAWEKKKEEWKRLEFRIANLENKLKNFYKNKAAAEQKEKKRQEAILAKQKEKAEKNAILENSEKIIENSQNHHKNSETDSALLRIYKISRHLDALAEKPKESISIENLEKLKQTLNELLEQNEKVGDLINDCHHQINFLLSPEFLGTNNQHEILENNHNEVLETHENLAEIPNKNQEMMEFINLLLANFNHWMSNTRAKYTGSFGDGSFISKTFRPFLRSLNNEIFAKNKIILTDEFSWAEIIDVYKTHVDDTKISRQGFIGILAKQDEKVTTIAKLKEKLLDAAKEFSTTNYYNHEVNKDKNPLKNVLSGLSKIK